MKLLLLLLTTALVISIGTLTAQDQILKKSGDIIECRITEMGIDEIKFKTAEMDDVVMVIDKRLVEKVIMDGRTIIITDALDDKSYYVDQRKSAIKVDFLSPLFGFTGIHYEQSLKPGQSLELGAGIIGLGFNNHENSVGGFIDVGYKLRHRPLLFGRGDRYSHLLNGSFIRPRVTIGSFNTDGYERGTGELERIKKTYLVVALDFGRQYVLADVATVETYFGLGYGGSVNYENDYETLYYSNFILDNFVVSGGLRVGILLPDKKAAPVER